MLAAALAAELVDELADGAKSASVPLIQQNLHLTLSQVGLLASLPLLLGSLLELPFGILAGTGRRRRRAVLAGGAVFILALAGVAVAPSFAGLLAAFVIFFPASGAFVGLTQSGLMDSGPGRRPQLMARWELAGSSGSAAGPLVLVAVLAAGGGWRSAYLVLAAAATAAWLAVARNPPAPAGPGEAADAADAAGPGAAAAARDAHAALRTPGVARCLILLQVCDLLLDVLTGFLAVYLVDAGRATPTQAALGVAVRLGAGLAADAALVWVIERIGALTLVRAGAAVAALAYPAFLIVPGIAAKLVVLGCLSVVTAPWYPVLLAELYDSLPGRSGVAVSLSSAAGLLGGAGPLAVGFAAQHLGLAWSMAGLAVVPAILLGGLWRWPRRDGAPPA